MLEGRLRRGTHFCAAVAQNRIRHLCKKVDKTALGGPKSWAIAILPPENAARLAETAAQNGPFLQRDFPLPMSQSSPFDRRGRQRQKAEAGAAAAGR